MEIEFDPEKDQTNIANRGLSLALAAQAEWASALEWVDTRFDYGEQRMVAITYIEDRLYVIAYTLREGKHRIISLRKANKREVALYANA